MKIKEIFRSYDFKGNRIINAKTNTPVNDDDIVNKKFVTDKIAEALLNIGVSIFPVYVIPEIILEKTFENLGEVGELISGISSTFNKNDAGNLINTIFLKNGVTDYTDVSNPAHYVNSIYRTLVPIQIQSKVSYSAGLIKNILGTETPDVREPAIRQINAPQASDNNFLSEIITIFGVHAKFSGTVTDFPTTSANVRSLTKNLTNTFVIPIQTGEIKCVIAYPSYYGDLSAENVIHNGEIDEQIGDLFVSTEFSVADASGNMISYKIYTLDFVAFSEDVQFTVIIPN